MRHEQFDWKSYGEKQQYIKCLENPAVFILYPREYLIVRGIPIEEFVFYITGFWFIIFFYVFCDEWYLKRYNVPDETYARYRSRLKSLIFVNMRGIYWAVALFALGVVFKRSFNPTGDFIPGYFTFLLIVAYVPFVVFFRVTRRFINWRAFMFCLILTTLISIVWEVTLAIPRGYWGYQEGAMLGLFIPVWQRLPIEAPTVWIFCSLVILVYEFVKICYFTTVPSVPGHSVLLKVGNDWRKKRKTFLSLCILNCLIAIFTILSFKFCISSVCSVVNFPLSNDSFVESRNIIVEFCTSHSKQILIHFSSTILVKYSTQNSAYDERKIYNS